MKSLHLSCSLASLLVISNAVLAAPVAPAFYGDAPDEHHAWAVHDGNRAQPKIVVPGTFSTQQQPGKPPSDAVILFDAASGDISKWEADVDKEGVDTKWIIRDGAMECVPGSGYIRTREKFGDCQLHVEWAAPTKVQGESQGRGNSGVFLMGIFEVQVLDNYNNPTYPDGTAGSLYGQHAPLANALRPPGEFQVYDIIFRRPIYKNGKLVAQGYITVFENGVAVEDHAVIEGPTGHMARTKAIVVGETGPLKLQDHGNPVRYRNIWYRPLPPRTEEGGVDGYLSTEAAKAERAEIAASIRDDAAKMHSDSNPVPEMLRLAESLVYETTPDVTKKVTSMATEYAAAVKAMPADKLSSKKDEIIHVRNAFRYLGRFNDLPQDFEPRAELDQIIKENKLEKK